MDDDLIARIDRESQAARDAEQRARDLRNEQVVQAKRNAADFVSLMRREAVAPVPVIAHWAEVHGRFRRAVMNTCSTARSEPTILSGWLIVRDHSSFHDNPGPAQILLDSGHPIVGGSCVRGMLTAPKDVVDEIRGYISAGISPDDMIAKKAEIYSNLQTMTEAARQCMTVGPAWYPPPH